MDQVKHPRRRITVLREYREEQAAIDACGHLRAEVTETDQRHSPDGLTVVGVSEHIMCPDCPLDDWFDRGTLAVLVEPS